MVLLSSFGLAFYFLYVGRLFTYSVASWRSAFSGDVRFFRDAFFIISYRSTVINTNRTKVFIRVLISCYRAFFFATPFPIIADRQFSAFRSRLLTCFFLGLTACPRVSVLRFCKLYICVFFLRCAESLRER